MGKRKKGRRSPDAPEPSPTTSLGGLLTEMGFAASETTSAAPEPASPTHGVDFANQPKLVLRMERKGRGGKTVTVLSQLRADDEGRARVARDLRRALGCGARVEGDDIIVQGDVRDRARTWLEKRGAKRIVG